MGEPVEECASEALIVEHRSPFVERQVYTGNPIID